MSRMFLKLASRAGARAFEKLSSFDQWIIAYRFDRDEFKYLIPPADRFWADPFQIKVDGRYYIFFEEYVNSVGRAHIAVVEVDQNGIVSGPTEVLKLDCHLSYPFVFEWQGDYYMIPEMGERNVVELYRAYVVSVQMETRESFARSTLSARCDVSRSRRNVVDVCEHSGRRRGGKLGRIASLLLGQPAGSVAAARSQSGRVRCSSARPAGRLFRSKNVLYRPSQDSSLRYGYATTINKVTDLSPTTYKETEVLKITPGLGQRYYRRSHRKLDWTK